MDYQREQQHLRNTITTLPQFLTWFGNWALAGDHLAVHVSDDEARVFKAYDITDNLVAEFSEKHGIVTHYK